ncbi:MAG: type 4a pilus biogenesis protein PilO [Planctomycetaceae bacterium]|nr:type 4a pilus biogenesis protein PilO [Planctomycetaceae bacterium]
MTLTRQSNWIVTLSLAAVALAYLTLVWLPGRKSLAQLQQTIELKRAVIAQSTGLSDALLQTHRELNETETLVRQWEKISPGKKDSPALYGKIHAMAKNSRLSVTRFDPQPIVSHEQLKELPIVIACSGSFDQIYEFLRCLEQQSQTIWVENLRMDKKAKNTKDVQCEISLVVFSDNL